MKRVVSFLLAILMLISMIPVDIVRAAGVDAENGEKLDVVLLRDGQYMIKLPGVDYTMARQAPVKPDINPTDNPKDFSEKTVKVDITDLFIEATGLESYTFTVTCVLANYSKEYTVNKSDFGKGFKVPVPKEKHIPVINVKFDDGRDARYAVEAKTEPNGPVTITIDFLGHTGVATKWHGTSDKPDVKANYVGINNSNHEFDLPKVDQNSILREGDDPWAWKGHDNIVKLYNVPLNHIRCNDKTTAMTIHLLVDNKAQGQLASSKYYFQVTGDGLHGFTATMREKNTVDFDAGDGTWKAPATKPAQQFAANGLKLNEKFMEAPDTIGPVAIPNGDTDLTPPEAESGKPAKKFAGWSTTKNGPAVDMSTYVVEGDVTFYALYEEEEQGKVKVEYKDSKTNKPIDSKYQLKGQEYPAEKPGDMDKAIKDEVFDTNKAPKFLGYKIKSITTDPVPNPPATANYTKNGDYTVIYTYDKLDDIIPEKKNGQDNPDVTPDVKEHYAKVTFQVAAADDEKAKLQLSGTDATSPLVYYVNPLEGKTIAQVADVKAVSKDDNFYKVDANDMWKFDPDTITGTNQVISQATDSDGNVVKTEITLTAKVEDKAAVKFKDKLDPETIKVWVEDPIDWKKGVKVKDDAKDRANLVKELETELAKPNADVADLGENGTIAQPATARNSKTQNLPKGKKGNLLVTFADGSTLVVNDQTLYVADKKVEEKDPKDKDYINPDNLPDDKVKVEIKLGEGVKEAKQGGKVGNAANPVVIKTYYVKPGTGLAKSDFPTTTGENAEIVKQSNYLTNISWDPSELTKTFAKGETGSFVASTVKAQCNDKDTVKANFEKVIDPMFENIKKKDGVYLGKYDKENKKVTVAIMDKTKPFSELKGTGLVAGIKDLLKNHNLIKYQVGTQTERDLKAIEKASGTEQELVNNLAQIVGSDIGNEINGQGSNINTLADFIGKKITLKLTVQEPDCEGNAVELTYTIEGKEAVSSILKGKLSPQDIKVWKGDVIDWEMGVMKDETGLTVAQKEQIKDEFSTYENGVKKTTGKANFADATDNARNSNTASAKPFVGNIKVTFSDGSELLVENQNLYVSELMTGKDDKNAPADAITVQFLLGNGVKAKKGDEYVEGPKLYETYKVKPNLNLDTYKLGTNKTIFDNINPESKDPAKFKNIVWTPADHVATAKNNKFTAMATESFIMKHTFKLLDKDNKNAEISELPQVLKDKLAQLIDKEVAKGKTYKPENLAPIKEVKEADNKFYDYTFVKWEPAEAKDEDKTFVGTWTREQSTSKKPIINPVKPEDKNITGKGVPGSEIEVTIPGVKDPIKTKVDQNGDWTVKVPEDKKLKTGEEIVVTQKELGKKPNSDNTKVGEEPKPEPQPQPMPTPEYNPWWPIWFGSTKTEAKPEPKHLERHEEYIAGYPDGTVRPDGKITRAEVSAIFARLTENSAPANYSSKFSDVRAYDWFCDSVMKLSKKDIIKGYPDGTFKPNKSITRAEFAVIASKYIKNPKAADETFSDVPMNHWAKDAIAKVKAEGWISGYTDGTFKPDAPITRAEAVSIVNRMFDRAADGEFVREHGFEIKKFNDLTDKHWAYYEIMEAVHTHDYERIDKRTERWDKIVK